MPTPVPGTANEFLELVQKSGVLDQAQFAAHFPDADALPPEPSACATALIKAGLLTRYQAEQLLAGRFRGFRLGAYKILQPIGKGGMGMVYLGEHVELKRRVAVKVLPQAQAKERLARERFFREGRAAAALDHPNIVRLYDISQAAGVHFLTLEYVDGTDLESLVSRKGPVRYSEAVSYVTQAAGGLQHAHEKGFVHRDIKPANLMLGTDGVVKILDMGLARSFESANDNLTGLLGGEGEAVGTADFVSPEQALGQPVDARGDIYSLGATLYALISGRPPFKGNITQLLVQHQLAPLPPLPATLDIPDKEALDEVIDTMMAKDPDDRYQTAAEVIEALQPWLGDPGTTPRGTKSTAELRTSSAPTQVVRTRPEPAAKEPSPDVKTKKMLAAGIAGGGLLVFVAVVIAAIAFTGGGDSTPAATIPRAPEEKSPPVTVAQPITMAAPPASGPEVSQRLTTALGQIQDIAFAPTGDKAAAIDWSGPISLWEANPPKQVRSIPSRGTGRFNCCTITPDGKHLIAGGNQVPIVVYDWATGETVRDFAGHIDTTWGVAVSPDGEKLLSCGNDGSITLRKLATGEEIRTFEVDARHVWCVAFSADGTKYAAGCGKGPTADESHVVRVWDTATGRELHKLTGHTNDVRWVTFRGDGGAVASAGFDGTVRQWNLADGKPGVTITAHGGGYAERVFYLAGGKQLLSGGGPMNNNTLGETGALKLWDAVTGSEVKAWKGEEAGGIIALAVAPNGEYALTGSRNKTLRLWKMPK